MTRNELKKKIIEMFEEHKMGFQNVYSERRKGEKYIGGKSLKFYNIHKTWDSSDLEIEVEDFIELVKKELGEMYFVKVTHGQSGHIYSISIMNKEN